MNGQIGQRRRVLYLDQNAWIALAFAVHDPDGHPLEYAALELIVAARQAGRVIIPLSFTNIYETQKINDPERRRHLARVQVTLSQGLVLRGRRRMMEEGVAKYICDRLSLPHTPPQAEWFISDLFFEVAGDYSPDLYGLTIPDRLLAMIRQAPTMALNLYLTEEPDDDRKEAVRMFTAGTDALIIQIESRRERVATEPFAMRRRAYGALLIIEELEFIFGVARRLGVPWSTATDIPPSIGRGLVTYVPVLNIERELIVRREDQRSRIHPNDLRDLAGFTVALPVADIVVGEKPFLNLARQARLGERYDTTLLTKVTDLLATMFE